MNELERLLIEQACQRLITQYVVATDANDSPAWLNVFSNDAIWEVGGRALTGREQLEKFFATRTNGKTTLGRHIASSALVTVRDADSASGISTLLVFRQTDYSGSGPGALKGAEMIVENADEFVRESTGWKIKHRISRAAFLA